MRILDIAIFMFIFTSAIGALNTIAASGGMFSNTSINITANITAPNASEIVNLINPENNTMSYTQFLAWNYLSMLIAPFQILVNLLKPTFALGYFLKDLIPFIPDSLAALLTATVDCVYAAGVVQFISGRGVRWMK